MRLLRSCLSQKDVEKVFVAPGNDGMTLDGLELVNISISEHFKLMTSQRPTILLGPLSVQMMPLRLVSWMISM